MPGTPLRTPKSSRAAENPESRLGFLRGGGEMGERIRAFDWSKTSLGPVERWSPALRTMVGILLVNRFPLLLWWGPNYISIYNDAYAPILGAKHPHHALGLPVSECWAEIWSVLKPLIDTPYSGGPSTWMEDIELEINRHGFFEETHFTVAYSPVPDETTPGGIGGVLATVHEITEKIIAERRAGILRELAASVGAGDTVEASCGSAALVLGLHAKDIPFAGIYLLPPDTGPARLAGMCGAATGAGLFPVTVDLGTATSSGWPLAETRRAEKMTVVSDLAQRFPAVEARRWSEVPAAAVVPIRSSKVHELAGLLVVGLSARLKFDDLYRDFVQSIANHLATAIANHRALLEERNRAEALAEIDRAKTAFFSNVSHEFRTPLTLMLGPLEELRTRAAAAPALVARQEIDVVHRNSLRLLKLVNTLLDFSRIEAGRAQAAFVATDLARLTAGLASVFRSAMMKANLAFTIDCPPLPEPVFVDADLWEKIVFNLLSNALKFTLAGEVRIALRADAGHALLSVRDTGLGIAPEELPNLFKRFHRVENVRSRTYEGTGIGLALVRELVTLHGGTIEAESAPGHGTEFRVRLPFGKSHLPSQHVATAADAPPKTVRAEAFVEEALSWLPGSAERQAIAAPSATDAAEAAATDPLPDLPRIILAEDNADMRDYVLRLLREHYQIEAVADGAAAWEAARRAPPDLILSDVMMPVMNGFELVQRLRGDPVLRTTPIILLSARAGDEARVEGASQGADDYLTKPFSSRELLARVALHLKLARTRHAAEAEVRRSEERFRAFVTTTADVVYRMSPDWSEMFHLVGKDFITDTPDPSRTWLQKYIHPEEQPRVLAAIAEAIRTKGTFQLEHRVIRVDGTLGWTASRAIPILDARGEIVEWLGAASDVTDAKRAERALHESEQRYRTLFNSMEEGFCVIEFLDGPHGPLSDYIHVEANPAYERHTGIPNVVGQRVREMVPQEAESWVERYRSVLLTGVPIHFEQELVATGRYLELSAFRVEPRSRRQVAVLFQDITARRRAEQEVQKAAERFAIVRDAAQVGFWFCDLPFDKLVWDSRVKDHFWLPPDAEVTIDLFYARIHPEDREPTRQAIETSIKNKTAYGVDYRTVSPDGRIKWIRAIGRGYYDETGRPTRFDGLTLDITERKQAEAALREGRERLQAALNGSGTGTFRWNIQTNALDWDENLDRLFGLPPGKTIRSLENFIAVVHPEERQGVIERCERCAREGADFDMEFRIIWPDGSIHWLDDQGATHRDAAGRPLYMTGMCLDITERKQAEEALRQALERAEAASQSKDSFLAALSHELRTPLTPVLMTAGTLKDDPRLSEDIREQLAMMERNIALEARLIDDLLDLTAIAHGKLQLRLERCDLNVLVYRAREMVATDALAKELTIACEFGAAQPALVADFTRLQQVVWNLLRNAVKFTPPGGKISIRTRETPAEKSDPWLTLEVTDTGIGIDAANLARIFEPFDQGSLAGSHRFGGLGLGLAIAQAVVTAHGGRISARSEGMGRGATFIVELPTTTSSLAKVDSPSPSKPAAKITPLDLLLVEDHPSTLQTLARLLQRDGHRVTTASSVASARAAAAQGRFDLVVSDLGLPDGTGIELMTELRSAHGLRGIALSGYGMREDIASSREAGFVAHLVKPVAISDLRRALADVLPA